MDNQSVEVEVEPLIEMDLYNSPKEELVSN